jgi:putative peptidoglycan lipid II flippase
LAAHDQPRSAEFRQLTAQTTRTVLTVAAAGTAALVASAQAVEEVFAAVDPGLVNGLATTLTAMAVGLVGYGLTTHLQRVLYAAGHTGLAGAGTAAGWLTATAGAVGAAFAGLPALTALGWGLAIGMSLSGLILLAGAVRVLGRSAFAAVPRTAVVALAGAAAGGLAGRMVLSGLDGAGAWRSLGAGLVAGAVAVAVLALMMLLADRSIGKALR